MLLRKSQLKKILLLFTILIVPTLAYLFLTTGKNNFKQLPVFYPLGVNSQGDTIYHNIPDFVFVNHEGNVITSKDFENKIYVADFFFASCKTICPKMTGQLQRVQENFKAQRELKLISHTVNPDRDSIQILSQYARRYMAKSGKWHFVTGNKKEIYDIARNGYFVTATEGDGGPEDFIHSEKLVLVDKQKRIRGYYDGTDKKDVDRLMDEIKVLLLEYNEK